MGRKSGFTSEIRKEERNKKLVELYDSGLYTLEQVGGMFDISRERVRQIYKRETGKSATIRRETKKKVEEIRRQKSLNLVAFKCGACGKPVTHREKGRRHSLCESCNYLQNVKQVAIYTTYVCDGCGVSYHPKRTSISYAPTNHKKEYYPGKHFHTQECYWEFRRRLSAAEDLQKKTLRLKK